MSTAALPSGGPSVENGWYERAVTRRDEGAPIVRGAPARKTPPKMRSHHKVGCGVPRKEEAVST